MKSVPRPSGNLPVIYPASCRRSNHATTRKVSSRFSAPETPPFRAGRRRAPLRLDVALDGFKGCAARRSGEITRTTRGCPCNSVEQYPAAPVSAFGWMRRLECRHAIWMRTARLADFEAEAAQARRWRKSQPRRRAAAAAHDNRITSYCLIGCMIDRGPGSLSRPRSVIGAIYCNEVCCLGIDDDLVGSVYLSGKCRQHKDSFKNGNNIFETVASPMDRHGALLNRGQRIALA